MYFRHNLEADLGLHSYFLGINKFADYVSSQIYSIWYILWLYNPYDEYESILLHCVIQK